MKLTICSETVFTDRPLVERFAPIRELGVPGIELWGLPTENVAAVEQGLRSAGCRLELFCGNRNHSLIDPDERAGFLSELRQSMESAIRLGCSRLTILSDHVDNRGIPIPPARPLSGVEKADSIFEGLTQAALMAESENITLLLEPLNTKVDHPGYTLAHSNQAFTIVRQVGSPHLKVLYDVYHMQIMEGDLISTIEASLSDIGHIHVADVPGRHEPGTGEINYVNIARMLKTKEYDGFIGLECFPRDRSEAAIEAFRDVFQ
ncbi:MAG: TIM barrel protein [Planctomycetia bacterium]|nr:TIM barrel protein [Planctomycetia bacterium]